MSSKFNDTHRYDDIINLPHHVSNTHSRMSVLDRAAQFAPFAALTGYGSAVDETTRLTDERLELDESQKAVLDEKLQMLYETIDEQPEITVTYFQPDELKSGGRYISVTGSIKRINNRKHTITFQNRTEIPFDDIYDISGRMFDRHENI
ncbi:MAG: hypothetical protein ACI4EA_05920 [Candidatus Ornithomonoglobus sp.]